VAKDAQITMKRPTRLVLAIATVAAIVCLPAGLEAQQASRQTKVKASTAAAVHKVAIQVDQNDKGVMDLALNNAENVVEHYKAKGETVVVEIVTFGPGLHMLRSESPVKERISVMSLQYPKMTFAACAQTWTKMGKAEGKPVQLLSEATVTPSGVVRLMELQSQGYAYIRP
jgi:intracellular sulfur oxidation DsrE/DsrF family protein